MEYLDSRAAQKVHQIFSLAPGFFSPPRMRLLTVRKACETNGRPSVQLREARTARTGASTKEGPMVKKRKYKVVQSHSSYKTYISKGVSDYTPPYPILFAHLLVDVSPPLATHGNLTHGQRAAFVQSPSEPKVLIQCATHDTTQRHYTIHQAITERPHTDCRRLLLL